MVVLGHQPCVGEEEVGVRLQVNASAVAEELPVSCQKIGGGQALCGFLHLRIAERQPQLAHFAGGKEAVDEFDLGAQEGHVGHASLQRLGGSVPHTCSLDVHADEVLFRKEPSEPHGVFAASAAQFQDDRVVVVKEIRVPFPAQGKGIGFDIALKGRFKHMGISGHIGKLGQFVLAHGGKGGGGECFCWNVGMGSRLGKFVASGLAELAVPRRGCFQVGSIN